MPPVTVRLQEWSKGGCWGSVLDFWTVFSLLMQAVASDVRVTAADLGFTGLQALRGCEMQVWRRHELHEHRVGRVAQLERGKVGAPNLVSSLVWHLLLEKATGSGCSAEAPGAGLGPGLMLEAEAMWQKSSP